MRHNGCAKLILICSLLVFVAGCPTLIWTKDALIIDGKDRNIDWFIVERDPNGFYMEGGNWESRAKNLKAKANLLMHQYEAETTSSVPSDRSD